MAPPLLNKPRAGSPPPSESEEMSEFELIGNVQTTPILITLPAAGESPVPAQEPAADSPVPPPHPLHSEYASQSFQQTISVIQQTNDARVSDSSLSEYSSDSSLSSSGSEGDMYSHSSLTETQGDSEQLIIPPHMYHLPPSPLNSLLMTPPPLTNSIAADSDISSQSLLTTSLFSGSDFMYSSLIDPPILPTMLPDCVSPNVSRLSGSVTEQTRLTDSGLSFTASVVNSHPFVNNCVGGALASAVDPVPLIYPSYSYIHPAPMAIVQDTPVQGHVPSPSPSAPAEIVSRTIPVSTPLSIGSTNTSNTLHVTHTTPLISLLSVNPPPGSSNAPNPDSTSNSVNNTQTVSSSVSSPPISTDRRRAHEPHTIQTHKPKLKQFNWQLITSTPLPIKKKSKPVMFAEHVPAAVPHMNYASTISSLDPIPCRVSQEQSACPCPNCPLSLNGPGWIPPHKTDAVQGRAYASSALRRYAENEKVRTLHANIMTDSLISGKARAFLYRVKNAVCPVGLVSLIALVLSVWLVTSNWNFGWTGASSSNDHVTLTDILQAQSRNLEQLHINIESLNERLLSHSNLSQNELGLDQTMHQIQQFLSAVKELNRERQKLKESDLGQALLHGLDAELGCVLDEPDACNLPGNRPSKDTATPEKEQKEEEVPAKGGAVSEYIFVSVVEYMQVITRVVGTNVKSAVRYVPVLMDQCKFALVRVLALLEKLTPFGPYHEDVPAQPNHAKPTNNVLAIQKYIDQLEQRDQSSMTFAEQTQHRGQLADARYQLELALAEPAA